MTTFELELADRDVRRIAQAVADLANSRDAQQGFLSVDSASAYCDMTDHALRAAERRGQLKGVRGETGRLRFAVAELDRFLGA